MPRTTTVEIQETVEELLSTLKAQKSIYQRNRAQSLYLIKKENFTITKAADFIGVERQTVQKWLSIYQDKGLSGLLKDNETNSGRKSSISTSIAQEIRHLVEQQYFKTYAEVRSWLAKNHEIEVDYSVVYRLIRDRLKLTI